MKPWLYLSGALVLLAAAFALIFAWHNGSDWPLLPISAAGSCLFGYYRSERRP